MLTQKGSVGLKITRPFLRLFVVVGNWIYIFEFAPTFSQPLRDKYPTSWERSINDVATTSASRVPEKPTVVFVLFSKAAAFQVNKKSNITSPMTHSLVRPH